VSPPAKNLRRDAKKLARARCSTLEQIVRGNKSHSLLLDDSILRAVSVRRLVGVTGGSREMEIRCCLRAEVVEHRRSWLDVDPNGCYWFHGRPRTAVALGVGSSPHPTSHPFGPMTAGKRLASTIRRLNPLYPRVILTQGIWVASKLHSTTVQ